MTTTQETTTTDVDLWVSFEKRAEAQRDNGCNTGMGHVWLDDEDGAWHGTLDGFGMQTYFTGGRLTAAEAMTDVMTAAVRLKKAETVGAWTVSA